jgi:competence protein ComEC
LQASVQFEVLHPSVESYANPEIKDNNRSCVVKVTSQFGSILLTGDIEKDVEIDLLRANRDKLTSDILVVPHHGSKTSSTVDFVQAVNAKQVIFTVGYLNRFKHPKPLIEKRFEESGALTYRSDYQGALQLNFMHKNGVEMNAWRQSQPRYWHDKY